MNIKLGLKKKFSKKQARIGIIGLGYVGLPLMLRYVDVGFTVYGFDLNPKIIKDITKGKSYIEHIPSSKVKEAINSGRLAVTSEISAIKKCDAIIICVPTPLNKFKEPDLSFVLSTLQSIKTYIRKGQVLSLESTTYPGTTEEEIVSKLNSMGFKVGKDFFVVYSPEREDPGNELFNTSSIPKICGGHTKNCTEIGISLYEQAIEEVIPVSSTKVAEMTKLLENIHRAVNIGLMNEMKIVSDKMDVDIYEVIEAASTKPFGFTPYYPGPGLGGHCIPIDPFYLTWKAKEFGIHTRFIELSGEINNAMPEYVVSKLADSLNERSKTIKGSKILVLGIAYKKNIDDIRESPSLEIMSILRKRGANLSYSDPHVLKFPITRKYKFDLKSIKLTQKSLNRFDAVIIATNHDEFDYELIKENSSLIIDSRGVYKVCSKNIIRA